MHKFIAIVLFSVVCANELMPEDSSCTKSDGQPGICVSIYLCEEAITLLQTKANPQTCGFKGKIPLVCCSRPGIKSKRKCAEYHHFDYEDTERHSVLQAVGGEDALAQEFPHMAVLGFGDKTNIQWLCGGTLISEEYVMTAAHCLYTPEFGYVKHIRLGDLNLNISTDTADPQDFEVSQIYRHPEYKPPKRYHDIALLKLDKPAKLTDFVIPACLNTKKDVNNEYPAATGWGRLSYGGESSPHLQKVFLQVYSFEACNKTYENSPKRQLPIGLWEDTQVCAGSPNEIKDTCQGDSGGPLQTYHERVVFRRNNVIGITSFGKGCGLIDTPGVYTRVSYYIPWIESIVWPN